MFSSEPEPSAERTAWLNPWIAIARRYFEHHAACALCPSGKADACAEGMAIRQHGRETLAALRAARRAGVHLCGSAGHTDSYAKD